MFHGRSFVERTASRRQPLRCGHSLAKHSSSATNHCHNHAAYHCDSQSRFHDVCDRGDIVCDYPNAAGVSSGTTIHTTHYRSGGEAEYFVTSAATNVSKITQLRAPTGPSVTGPDLGTLPGGTTSTASDVSGNIIVGSSGTADGNTHAFVYDLSASSPHMVDLGIFPGGRYSAATGVDGNLIVGSSDMVVGPDPYMDVYGRAFFYDLSASNPHMVDLGTLPGGNMSRATAVSGNLIVGAGNTADGQRSFFYDLSASNPHMVDLGTLPGGTGSSAAAVDGNIIVGSAGTADGHAHAFVYDLSTGQMTDLGAIDRVTGWAYAVDGNLVVGETGSGPYGGGFPMHATLWELPNG